jgi:aminopeptidase-like protein
MTVDDVMAGLDLSELGEEMYALVAELYPICRSITGDGFRETLRRIGNHIPIKPFEVPTGTAVFDWTVPREWNIRDAYVKNDRGERVIDFRESNLHVVSYSVPVRANLSLEELKGHLFTLPEHPDWIPYRTSYYEDDWGFCLSHSRLQQLKDGRYDVCIDSSLEDGNLTYGEYYLRGESEDEVLISCHACHPSLCNDNLSGVAVATMLAKYLCRRAPRFSYRFLFIPGTIGSIAWLCLHQNHTDKIKHGLVLTGVGDPGHLTYKRSRRGDADIDRAFAFVLKHTGRPFEVMDFVPYGYDERQYCSPGFDLPVGCLMRTPHGRYPEYHTSADNLEFVRPAFLADSFLSCWSVLALLEGNGTYVNRIPRCEPQLGKRGLYRKVGGHSEAGVDELAMLWTLNFSDGQHTLLDIADRSGLSFSAIQAAADLLLKHDLLVGPSSTTSHVDRKVVQFPEERTGT